MAYAFGPLAFIEFATALAALGFGLWLLNPFVNLFAKFPAYAFLARVADENIWGGLFLGAGVLQLIGVSFKKTAVLLTGATAILFLRTFLFFGVGFSTKFSVAGIPDFFIWAVLSAYIIFSNRIRPK